MFLLAQLVAPPLQPGPVRIPSNEVEQRTSPAASPVFQQPGQQVPAGDGQDPAPSVDQGDLGWTPDVQGGDDIFSQEELSAALGTCRQGTVETTLKSCAAKLTSILINRGYINSRVFVLREPEPGALEIVLWRISEINITSSNPELKEKAEQELNDLIGSVLHLPSLEQALVELKKRGFGQIKGGMGRLGGDPTTASISLNVEAGAASPIQGDISLGNNGNVVAESGVPVPHS